MPLILKNQPTYYYFGNLTQSGKLYTVPNIVESDGTNVTNAGTYTIPANMLNKDGSILQFTYFGNSYNSPTTIS